MFGEIADGFERDAEKSDDELRLISISAEAMFERAKPLLRDLKVNKDKR